MHPYPHSYQAAASGTATGRVTLSSQGLPDLPSAPPPQFDGPGDVWSPETLLCAAVSDCFVLTFRAIARASKFEWTSLQCQVEGLLERAEGGTRFTHYVTRAVLQAPVGVDRARATQLLEKAERGCLVAASLNGERELRCGILEG